MLLGRRFPFGKIGKDENQRRTSFDLAFEKQTCFVLEIYYFIDHIKI